jgi:hypothetical protein
MEPINPRHAMIIIMRHTMNAMQLLVEALAHEDISQANKEITDAEKSLAHAVAYLMAMRSFVDFKPEEDKHDR